MENTSIGREEAKRDLHGQVEMAQACAILASAIALAVLISNFGSEPEGLAGARVSAEGHRQQVIAHEQMLRDNEAVLRQTEEALARVRASRSASP